MNTDAFWCITLSLVVLRWWWKNHHVPKAQRPIPPVQFTKPQTGVTQEALRAKETAAKQRAKDEEALRKQGYTDELIATILPIVESDN